MAREPHPTKKGPGRRHKSGQKHGAAPVTPKGGKFLGQRVNAATNARRSVKAEIGARQYRKQRKALASSAREVA
jgi:hypothetical protein